MAARLRKQARAYRRGGRPILPAFELIATVASGAPGDDGNYSYRQPPGVIDRYLEAARKERALLILDVQPGPRRLRDARSGGCGPGSSSPTCRWRSTRSGGWAQGRSPAR